MESFQPTDQVGLRCFNHQMIKIPHQAVQVTAPLLLLNFTAQEPEEVTAVSIIQKNGLLRIATGGEVIEGARKF